MHKFHPQVRYASVLMLLLTLFCPSASAFAQSTNTSSLPIKQAPRSAPSSALTVSLQITPVPNDQADLIIDVTSRVDVDVITPTIRLDPALEIVKGRLPATDTLAGRRTTYALRVRSKQGAGGHIAVTVAAKWSGSDQIGIAVIDLAPSRKGLVAVEPKIDKHPTNGIRLTAQQLREMHAKKRQQQQRTQSTVASTVTISGTFSYWDHPARPNPAAGGKPVGVDPTPIKKSIRRASITLLKATGTMTVPVDSGYTDNNGAFSITTSAVAVGDTIKVQVCAIGPDSNDLLSVEDQYSSWCYSSPAVTAQSSTDFGAMTTDQIAPDQADSASAPFNVFDTILEAYELLTREVSEPTTSLAVKWYPGYTSGSQYALGWIDLNGMIGNGDQWDESVIAHEFGHWVMDHYSAFPPLYTNTAHGSCDEGHDRPNLSYSEGWATFFGAASRYESRSAEVSQYASVFFDTRDDDDVVGTSRSEFNENLNTPTIFDQSTPWDFRKGNFCEWQVAGALWDIYDPVNDGSDHLTRSLSDIFTAFRAQVPFNAGAQYPKNINEWWYNWTNRLNSRSAGTSLGDEQAVLDILAKHKIQPGVQMQFIGGPGDMDAHLWLPENQPSHVFYEQRGQATAFPYASLDRDDQTDTITETITIPSPLPGTYTLGVFNWLAQNTTINIAGTGATVYTFDGSNPSMIETLVPSTGDGGWWHVGDVNVLGASYIPTNEVQYTAPSSYEAVQGTGIGKVGIVTGSAWFDRNGDGVRDVDDFAAISFTFTLRRDDGDNVFEEDEDSGIQSANVNAQGNYVFVDVPAGTYWIDPSMQITTTPNPYDVTLGAAVRVEASPMGIYTVVGRP